MLWRSNGKDLWTLATKSIFLEWFMYFFCPAVEKYCAKNNLSNKALLILDNAPCHPVSLSDLSDHVRVEYLHDNAADSIQPMGQGVASTFKAHYLRRTFEHMPARSNRWGGYSYDQGVLEKLQHLGCCRQHCNSLGGTQASNNEQCVEENLAPVCSLPEFFPNR